MVAYGSGVNTDSQLGYQEYPPKSGECHARFLCHCDMLSTVLSLCFIVKDRTLLLQYYCKVCETH